MLPRSADEIEEGKSHTKLEVEDAKTKVYWKKSKGLAINCTLRQELSVRGDSKTLQPAQ